MTLHAFLTQVGTLLLIGLLIIPSLRRMNRPHPSSRPSSQASPRPMTRLSIDESWTPEQCAEVFETLQYGEEIHFFAADIPSPSDPGGYVTVMRHADGHLTRWVGNHGWHIDTHQVSLQGLRGELYRNRAAQTREAYRVEKAKTH